MRRRRLVHVRLAPFEGNGGFPIGGDALVHRLGALGEKAQALRMRNSAQLLLAAARKLLDHSRIGTEPRASLARAASAAGHARVKSSIWRQCACAPLRHSWKASSVSST